MQIHEKLNIWYNKEKRDLPWRNSNDPYRIWLSEIILQQTKVAQGTAYYIRFIEKFPDVFSLAEAQTDEVLKIWQGLGYYSRARNLHETAKTIAFKLNGIFPQTYSELLKLKGIGEYTAAAISSIAFNEPKAAVDGNVKRVISRLFSVKDEINSGSGKKALNQLSEEILDKANPGLHNQAMMELGASICLPRKPTCIACPLNINCLALKDNIVTELPLKYKKSKAIDRFFTYLIIRKRDFLCLQQRVSGDIWEGLYEFPLIETSEMKSVEECSDLLCDFLNLDSGAFKIEKVSGNIIHKLSHRNINARFCHIRISGDINTPLLPGKLVNINEFEAYPVPKLIDRYISLTGLL